MYNQGAILGADGIARNTLATGNADAVRKSLGGIEGYDVSLLYGLAHQTAIGQ